MWIWTETKKNNPKHDVSKIFTVFFLSILWICKLYSAYDTILSKFAIQNDEIFGGFWWVLNHQCINIDYLLPKKNPV